MTAPAENFIIEETGLPARDGIYRGMPESVYHRRVLGVVSKSALMHVAKTPMHYKAWVDGDVEDEETDALAFGRAFHCAVLEPARFATDYATMPNFGDRRFKAAKDKASAWKEANEGKTIVDAADATSIAGMAAALRAHPLASRMIAGGERELTAMWTDDETGLRCKVRADLYSQQHRMIADVKSTTDASPEAFRRDVFKHKYHWQHVLYRLGFAAVGEKVEHFVFIAVEKKPPYAIGVYTLDTLGVSLAHDRVRLHMGKLAACMSAGHCPGYDTSIQTIETPPWET